MGRPPSFSPNLCIRQSHKISGRNAFRDRTSINGNVIKRENEECRQNPNSKVHQNFQEIAIEVSRIIRTRPRWEQSLLSDFSALNFADPVSYQEVLKQQKKKMHFCHLGFTIGLVLKVGSCLMNSLAI